MFFEGIRSVSTDHLTVAATDDRLQGVGVGENGAALQPAHYACARDPDEPVDVGHQLVGGSTRRER